jgi:hypothetical protein
MNTRVKGLIKLLIGAPLFGLIISWLVKQHGKGREPFIEATLMAAPGAFGLIGLIELATGTPFSKFSESWNRLQGWQRGVLGVVVCSATFLVLTAALFLFAQ